MIMQMKTPLLVSPIVLYIEPFVCFFMIPPESHRAVTASGPVHNTSPSITVLRLEKGSGKADSEDTSHGTLSGSCTRVLGGGSVVAAGTLAGAGNSTGTGARGCAGSATDGTGSRAGSVRCS